MFGVNRHVDVRPERERHSPMGHRQLRIQLRGPLERADSFVVVEAVNERESLIEESLSFRVVG